MNGQRLEVVNSGARQSRPNGSMESEKKEQKGWDLVMSPMGENDGKR